MENIILIGMPGAGKSTIGQVLAKRLDYTFTDTDAVIEQKYGKSLCALIEEHGEPAFLQMENETVAALNVRRTVIATGGSIVFGRQAMENLHRLGKVVYLKWNLRELEHRLGDLKARGVVMNGSTSVREIFAQRSALYDREADFTLEGSGRSAAKCAEQIIAAIRS